MAPAIAYAVQVNPYSVEKERSPKYRVSRYGVRAASAVASRHSGSTSNVAMRGSSLSAYLVGLFRQRMDTARINPAIIEIEQRAHGNGEVYRLVIPSQRAQGKHVVGGNSRRIVVHLVYKSKQRFVLIIERGSFEILQHSPDQFFTFQQFRRNCGVGLQSKRTVVAVRRIGGDQFADSRTKWGLSAHNLLRESRQLVGSFRQ